MNKLLEIKHWVLLTAILMPSIIIDIVDLTGRWYFAGVACYAFIYMLWLFLVGIKVYRANLNSGFEIILFKVGSFYPLIYLFVIILYDPPFDFVGFPIWLIPFHILAMLFEFYFIFFVSKNLVHFEMNRHLGNKSIFWTFCAFWIFPIGVFFVQPRENLITGGSNNPFI